MRYPAYPRYKPSGIEWLGDVPEHWEVKRSDSIISVDREQIDPEKFQDQEVFHYSIPVVQEKATGQIENGESIASAKQLINKPVVLVSKLNPRKATICKAVPQDMLTLCSTEFIALNADRCDLSYLEYVSNSEQYRQSLDSKVQSVTRSHQRANPADIYKFWNAWPPLPEQKAIVRFLCQQTGQIDALVTKKRELIERLMEKRTALISQTVTRGLPPDAARAAGLDPYPKLKPSGIEWLGEIPEHWEIAPLGFHARFYSGATPDKTKSEYWDGFIPWVSPKDMKVSEIVDAEDHVTKEALENSTLRIFPIGVVLIVVRGMILAHSFPVAQTIIPATINQDMKALICGKRLEPSFLRWLFSGFERVFVSLTEESAHGTRKLETELLKHFPILLPPLTEQHVITSYLEEQTANLDALIAKVEEAIERLQEYRTALITAAVTGKIDVREKEMP